MPGASNGRPPDRDHAVAVNARTEGEAGLEPFPGQRQQQRGLVGEVLADSADPQPDPAALPGLLETGEGLVENVDAGTGVK